MVNPDSFNDIYSSDKSLIRAIAYGGDISEFTNLVRTVADHLLLDTYHNRDNLMKRRGTVYVRDLFIDSEGKPINPAYGVFYLLEQAKRLADALELRNTRPELGLHTTLNSQTARTVLMDIDEFFKESDSDYEKYRADRGGTVYYG